VLSISGEKKSEREEKKKDYVLSERSYGSFKRAFTLPDNVDVEKIAAKYEKGVLKVTLPKTTPSPAKHREIPIKG
jgi:HSP20 family protein